MQHDIVLKKLEFLPFDPRVMGGGGGGGGGFGQNICYLVATFCDFNKFDMQHDHVLKKLKFDILTQRSSGWVCGQSNCYHDAIFRDSI